MSSLKTPKIDKKVQQVVEALIEQEVGAMTDGQLAAAYRKLPLARLWCAQLYHEVYRRLQRVPLAGCKLVEGRRPPKAWKDELLAEALLLRELPLDSVYDVTLISPARAGERMHLSDALLAVVEYGKPYLMVVGEDDPRPAVTSAVEML